jgi:hypothetical protein
MPAVGSRYEATASEDVTVGMCVCVCVCVCVRVCSHGLCVKVFNKSDYQSKPRL